MKRGERRKWSATRLSIGLLRGSSIKYALAVGEPRQFWGLQITERYGMRKRSGVGRAEFQSGRGWYYARRFDQLPESGVPGSVVWSRARSFSVLVCFSILMYSVDPAYEGIAVVPGQHIWGKSMRRSVQVELGP